MADVPVDTVSEPTSGGVDEAPSGDESRPVEQGKGPQGANGAAGTETPAPRRKVKVGDVEVDLDDEEFRKLNAVEMRRGAQEAFRKATEARREAQTIQARAQEALKKAKEDPRTLLQLAGMDEEEQEAWAESVLKGSMRKKGYNPETGQPYTPAEMAYMRQQEEIERLRGLETNQRTAQEQQQRDELKKVVRAEMDKQITSALKETGLPNTPYTIYRLAEMLQEFDFQVPAAQLSSMVMQDIQQEMGKVLQAITVDEALKLLPKEFMDKLRKHDLEKAKKGGGPGQQKPQVIPENRGLRRNQKITSPREAQKALDEWAGLK